MSTDTITISEAVKLLGIPQESVFEEFCLISIKKADVTAIFSRRLLAMGQPVAVVAPGKPPKSRGARSKHYKLAKTAPRGTPLVDTSDLAAVLKISSKSVRRHAVTRGLPLYRRQTRQTGSNLPLVRACLHEDDAKQVWHHYRLAHVYPALPTTSI